MRAIICSVCLMVWSAPLAAQTCTFTSECFEAEACGDTSFSMSVENGAMVTDAETIPVSQGGSAETRVFVGVTASAFHVLTAGSDGTARYSTHIFDGPLMVNYLGACD